MEIAELFNQLESNQPHIVEEIKKTFHENFNTTKESWLVSGLFDYYVSTSSMRSVEILAGVREPHDKHIFDKITDNLKGPYKLQALTLLGHIVRRRPTWVYKITQHQIMKELLKLLKAETDILVLMSAVLIIIVLLPMIPALIGPFLQDVFEVFSRLAAWNTNNPTKLPEEHLLHLQVSLYALFHRLYGMYPCNFISFLRHEYGQREHLGIFSHTIKPMLETVKMHPLLVTASKDAETATTRWKKMEDHDVIVECAKYAVDTLEKSREDGNSQSINTSLRSRGSLEHAVGLDLSYMQHFKNNFPPSTSSFINSHVDQDFWSPSLFSGLATPPVEESAPTSIPQTPNSQSYVVSASLSHQEGTSPPEAAIEATPETTPVKDIRHLASRHPPVNSSAARALNTFSNVKWQGITSGSSTPCQSQPSSPMKKELSPFRFPETGAYEQSRRDSVPSIITQKLNSVHLDRQAFSELHSSDVRSTLNIRPKTSGQPTSPLRIITQNDLSIPSSPVPTEIAPPLLGGIMTKPQNEKNGFRIESSEPVPVPIHSDSSATQEDQEMLEIVGQGEQLRIDTQPKYVGVTNDCQWQCDSVLQEVHPPHVGEYEECQQESGSPCPSGGLHMPNSRSMLDFARRVHHRQRFYSQCVPDSGNEGGVGLSTGSSPGQGSNFPIQDRVRRANSCPEMKKGPGLPTSEVNISRPLDESEEYEEIDGTVNQRDGEGKSEINGKAEMNINETEEKRKRLLSASTQTVDWVPLPYEHLFLSVFPPMNENCDKKYSSIPSPAPVHHQTEASFQRLSPYTMVDKYIETIVQGQEAKKPKHIGTETEIRNLKEQLSLLNIQLHFERQRREVHAERNRRLLGKSRSNCALDEHNIALRDQLSLLQKDIEQLHAELDKCKKEAKVKEQQLQEMVTYWQNECISRQKETCDLKTQYNLLEQELKEELNKNSALLKEMQEAESKLFDLGNEMKQAIAQAVVGEQLKESMEQLQKKLLLMGELQQRYRDRFSRLSLLRCPEEEEVTVLQESYASEVQSLQDMLEARSSLLEAAKMRVSELETLVCRKDQIISEQKKSLKSVEEEYDARLEAVESKYRTQRAINKRMEEEILELFHRLDLAEQRKKKEERSFDGSGAENEVIVGSPDSAEHQAGPSSFSPHNSPLSQSLGSPGGISVSGIVGRDCGEMKNLQIIVDQPESVSRPGVSTGNMGNMTEPNSTSASAAEIGANSSAPVEEG